MNNFARLVLLTYKGSFVSWQGHGYLTRAFLEPLLTVLTVTLAGKFAANPQIAERYVIGMLAFLIAWVVSYGILESFYNERAYGTLSLLILSRARRLTIYYARAGIQWLNGLVTFTTGLVGAWLILGLDLSDVDWVSLVITVAAMIISSTTFALLIANFSILFYEFSYVFQFVYGVSALLTGAIIPTDRLPDVLRVVSQFIPFTHGIVALRGSFAGAGAAEIGNQLLFELAIGASYAIVGFALFRVIEREARRRGNLEQIME